MKERKIRKLIINSLPIETNRLMLRYIELSDAYDMYEYASRNDVCEYLLWSPHINLAATEGYIEFLQQRYKRGLYADWALVLKDTGKMIGTCGYASINTVDNECEIGYILSPEYQGKGYMSEAVGAVLDLSFNVLNFECANLRIIMENVASLRLAERLGFHKIGYTVMEIKGKDRDVVLYKISKEEYKK